MAFLLRLFAAATRARIPALIWALALPLALAASPAEAERRLALVIGNGDYAFSPLDNPENDARLMAQSLQQTGFQVTALTNADQNAMKRAIRQFSRDLDAAGPEATALFYFAGHGVQVKGRNYLIPVNALIENEADMDYETIEAQWVLDILGEGRTGLSIVVLDACRNNPFRSVSRAAGRGLARMDAPTGSILAFSTAPGQVALDGDGRNSPYSAALAQAILTPGLKIEEAFKEVRRSVVDVTARQQVPWESSSLIGDFYFAGSAGAAQPVAITLPGTPASNPGGTFRDCPDCPEMVSLPSGHFTMGSDRHGPPVAMDMPGFAIGKTEVTRGDYARFVSETGRRMAEGCWYLWGVWLFDGGLRWNKPGYAQTDRHPAICLRFSDAQAYADWLSRKTSQRYRLPSEAEWEYAAGGSTGRALWQNAATQSCLGANSYDLTAVNEWGRPLMEISECDDGHATTAPVASYRANAFGLHDMIGNAWEWTADCWNASHSGRAAGPAARLVGDCNEHVMKGGHFVSDAPSLTPAFRQNAAAELPNVYGGFRLVRELR